MAAADLFRLLYIIVPFTGIAGYLPQIATLLKASQVPEHVSLPAWSVWSATCAITLGYAVFAIEDVLITATSALSLICHLLIISVTAYKRRKYAPRPVTIASARQAAPGYSVDNMLRRMGKDIQNGFLCCAALASAPPSPRQPEAIVRRTC
jgi:hypothetical protein